MKHVAGIFKVAQAILSEDKNNQWYKVAKLMHDTIENDGKAPHRLQSLDEEKPEIPFIEIPRNTSKDGNGWGNPYPEKQPNWHAFNHLKDCLKCDLKYHTGRSHNGARAKIKEYRKLGRI